MNAIASLKPIADWTDEERADLHDLVQVVYPPEANNWPGRYLQWTPAEWGVRVVNSDGELLSYSGIVLRQASHDGRPVTIGGIGGVKTYPNVRKRGYAVMGLRRAAEFIQQQPEVEFALLVCKPTLFEYYARLGWKEFSGRLLTEQKGETVEFTMNSVMVLDVHSTAPLTGTIDLLGPPW